MTIILFKHTILMLVLYTNLIMATISFKKILVNDKLLPSLYINKNTHINSIEHIFPRSLINKEHYNDMHNLFKTNNIINNKRSNYKFAEIENIKEWEKIEDDNYVNHKKRLFMPNENSKGIVSRAIMYMSYEYKYNYEKIIDLETLMEWCLKYKPSKEEQYHNSIVFKHQYKRNIFIDTYNKKKYKNMIYSIFN